MAAKEIFGILSGIAILDWRNQRAEMRAIIGDGQLKHQEHARELEREDTAVAAKAEGLGIEAKDVIVLPEGVDEALFMKIALMTPWASVGNLAAFADSDGDYGFWQALRGNPLRGDSLGARGSSRGLSTRAHGRPRPCRPDSQAG